MHFLLALKNNMTATKRKTYSRQTLLALRGNQTIESIPEAIRRNEATNKTSTTAKFSFWGAGLCNQTNFSSKDNFDPSHPGTALLGN
jgi:hypothetical protein